MIHPQEQMKIQKIKLTELKPLEQNVRKHSDKQIIELIRSVEQFGQTRAIVIDEQNNILIGNGLFMAMVQSGLDEAFVYRKRGLTEIEKKKLILADNKTYSLGSDDYENIESYLEEITASGDFEIAGFDEDMLRNLMRDADKLLTDVQNYGVLDQSVIEHKQQVAESREQAQPEQVSEQVSEQVNPQATPQEQTESAVETIVCPNCGECIPLD